MKCFEEATEVMMECLVEDHPDIVGCFLLKKA